MTTILSATTLALSFISSLAMAASLSSRDFSDESEKTIQNEFLSVLKAAKDCRDNGGSHDYSEVVKAYTQRISGAPSEELENTCENVRMMHEEVSSDWGRRIEASVRAELKGEGVSTRRWNQIQRELRSVGRFAIVEEVSVKKKGAQEFFSLPG